MTNKEKFKEVFGIDLPETCICTSKKFNEECLNKKYLNITGCRLWQNQKYEKPKSDIPMEPIGLTALVDDVLDNDTILLYGGWKIKGGGIGYAVNRYIEEEAKGKNES